MVIVLAAGVLFPLLTASAPAALHAEDWMFRPSFYSHEIPPEMADRIPNPAHQWLTHPAYRPAYLSNRPGFSVNGGFRYNRVYIQSGNSSDLTVYRRNWFFIEP